MAYHFFRLTTYLPEGVYATVYQVDYDALYQLGKRLLIIDIDNTLIPYDESLPSSQLMALFSSLKEKGFQIVLVSNNHRPRVMQFAEVLDCPFIASARKPFHNAYQQCIKLFPNISTQAMHAIGDQLITDVAGANQMGISCSLVRVLKPRSEKWYTKLNRLLEKRVLKHMDKHYPVVAAQIRKIQEY